MNFFNVLSRGFVVYKLMSNNASIGSFFNGTLVSSDSTSMETNFGNVINTGHGLK